MEEPWLASPGSQRTPAERRRPRERSAGSGGWPGVVEPGRADALALEGFGWLGGDFGGPGQDLGEQVKQEHSFVLGEGGHDAPLDGADAREQPIGGGAAFGRDLDQDAAAVELAQEGFAGAAQGCVCLRAGGVAAGVLVRVKIFVSELYISVSNHKGPAQLHMTFGGAGSTGACHRH